MRSSLHFLVYLALACFPAVRLAPAADDPLNAKTMIVYAANSPDSVLVKDHYIQARFSQPATAPVCAITLPDPNATALPEAVYINSVRTPIRNCLNTIGRTRILYIVLAYIRPFAVTMPRGIGLYAMDSYLTDIWDQHTTQDFSPYPITPHRYYGDVQNLGNVYTPFLSLDAFRAQPRSVLIYSVWRLDGATPAIAMGLVDKATQTMNNLAGAVCIDRNRGAFMNFVSDTGYGSGDWDLHKAAGFFSQAGFQVTEDPNEDEFGGDGLAPAKCPIDGSPVAIYAGWYSLNNYNGAGVFNFAPGAIGFHIDSLSAGDPRGGSNWSANALLNGITVTSGSVAEPYLQGLPRAGGLFRNLLEGANVGDAFLRNTRWIKWVVINIGDPLYRPFPATGKAPFNPPPALNSLAIAAREMAGGTPTTGTVTLDAPAGPGGATFALTSTNNSLLSVPSSVTIQAGQKSVSFPIATSTVTDLVYFLVTATSGSLILQNNVLLYPLLGSVTLSQTTVRISQTITGSVLLNASAPAGGITVNLASTDPSVATVPSTVFVSAGLGRVTFPVNVIVGPAPKSARIQASYNGKTVEAVINATP